VRSRSKWLSLAVVLTIVPLMLRALPAAACLSDSDCDDGLFCTDDHCIGIPAGVTPTPTPPPQSGCVGDCDGDHLVSIDELVKGVNVAIGATPLSACASINMNADGAATIDELIGAVNAALSGCP
jgi:hypothetical protein